MITNQSKLADELQLVARGF